MGHYLYLRKDFSTEIGSQRAQDTVSFFFSSILFLAIFGDVCQRRHLCLSQESDKIAYWWVLSGELAHSSMGYFQDQILFLCIFHLGPIRLCGLRAPCPSCTFPSRPLQGKGCQARTKIHSPASLAGCAFKSPRSPAH